METPLQPVTGQPTARSVALRVLYQVEAQSAYANLALDRALGGLSGPERRLAAELVYGTVKMRQALDWVLEQHMTRPLSETTPWIRNILRLGVFQLLYLERIPASAACHQAVELAKRYGHPGTARLVNAVLRAVARRQGDIRFPSAQEDPVGSLAIPYSHPRWMVERWLGRYGRQGTEALLDFNNRPAPTWLRVNSLRTDRETLARRLAEEGLTARPGRLSPQALLVEGAEKLDQLASFREGLFLVQEEGAMVVSHLLAPPPGSRVVDANAAPGGKATHLAELMGDRGEVRALDVHPHRVRLIEQNCRRLGVKSVRASVLDARNLGKEMPQWADFLLVDAPCSGLGVLRRRADARWRKTPQLVEEMRLLQLEILCGAAGALRPGGVLLYSTCSLEPEENQQVVQEFLARQPGFAGEDLTPFLPFRPEYPEDEDSARQGWLQLLPQRHGTEGFFAARLCRV